MADEEETPKTIRDEVEGGLTKLRAFLRDERVLRWITPHPRTMLEGGEAQVGPDFALEFATVCLLPHKTLFFSVGEYVAHNHPEWRTLMNALYLKTGLASFLVKLDLDAAPVEEVRRVFAFILFFLQCAEENSGEGGNEEAATTQDMKALLDLVTRASFARMNTFLALKVLDGSLSLSSTGSCVRVAAEGREKREETRP